MNVSLGTVAAEGVQYKDHNTLAWSYGGACFEVLGAYNLCMGSGIRVLITYVWVQGLGYL